MPGHSDPQILCSQSPPQKNLLWLVSFMFLFRWGRLNHGLDFQKVLTPSLPLGGGTSPSTAITPIFIPHIPAGPLLRDKGGTLDGISSLALLDALRSWSIISSQLLFQSYGEINTDMFSFVWALGKCLFSSSDGPPLYLHNGKKTTLPPSGSSECDLQSSSSWPHYIISVINT